MQEKTLLGIVNSFDPEAKLWQNSAVSVRWNGEKFISASSYGAHKEYMQEMDGWVFCMNRFASEQKIDHPPYAVYDARTLEMTPMTQEEFKQIGEL